MKSSFWIVVTVLDFGVVALVQKTAAADDDDGEAQRHSSSG
jgi:hypothetical protein